MKIFPDANVLVAAYLWDGLCDKIIDTLFEQQRHDMVLSEWVLQETTNTLRADFGIPAHLIEEFILRLKAGPRSLIQTTPLALAPYRVPDLDDRVVLTSALKAGADILISNDRDLLVFSETIKQAEGMLIIGPEPFWHAQGELW